MSRAARRFPAALAALLAAALLGGAPARAEEPLPYITLGSTTSTRDSGLLGALVPLFESQEGITVRVIAVGTGQAIQLGRHGDVDVLLVHDRPSEDAFLASGDGALRRDVMYNDFLLVGPAADPAGVRQEPDAARAFARIAAAKAPFLSRGDDSGTHKKELRIWEAAGIDPSGASGSWYRESGSGMGATLNTGAEMGAYILVDRGTWLAFKNRRGLEVVLEGDPQLRNPYGVLLVNPARHPQVKQALAMRFIDWITSPAGRAAIDGFQVDGQPLFFSVPQPQAGEPGARP